MPGDIDGPTVIIGADASGVDTVLQGITGKFQQLQADVAGIGGKFEQIGQSMSKVGIYATAGITAPMAAAVGAVGLMTTQAADFQSQLSEVFTLMPGLSKGAMDQMSSDVKSLSSEYGIASSDVIPALYQAISAGVPADNVFSFLETAAQTSIGGVTDLTSAVDVLTSVTNAYGTENLSVSDAADILFTGVKMGKTTIGELSANMSKVAPIAASMGLSLDQVVSGLDAMTMQGEGTAEASTKLKAMLAELSQEGSKSDEVFKTLAGKSFPEFIAQGGSLQKALSLLSEAARAQGGSVKNFFGSVEAGMGALMLTSEQGAQKYSAAMDEMDRRQGAALTAAETRMDTAKFKMDQIREQLKNAVLDIGEAFLPVLQNDILPIIQNDLVPLITGQVVPAIKDFANWFSNLDEGSKKAVAGLGLFLAAIGPLLMVLGPVVSAGGSLVSSLTGIGTAAAAIKGAALAGEIGAMGTAAGTAAPALAGLFGPAGILALGLGAGALAAYSTNLANFRDNVDSVIADIGRAAENISTGNYEEAGRNMAQAVADGFETVGDLIIKGIPEADALLKGFISGVGEVARGAGAEFRETLESSINTGDVVLDGLIQSITAGISSIDAMTLGSKIASDVMSGITNAPANIAGFVASIQNSLLTWNWEALGNQIGSLIAGGVKTINPIVGGPLVEFVDGFLNPNKTTKTADAGVSLVTGKPTAGTTVINVTPGWTPTGQSAPAGQSAAELLAKERDLRLEDAQKMLDSSADLRAKYESQAATQTTANKATEASTAAANDFTKSLNTASQAASAPAQPQTNPDGSAFSGPGSSRAIDDFTVDPSRYFNEKLNKAAKQAGFDTVSDFEAYLGEYGKTLKDKAREYFAEEKAAGFGGNWDFDAWFSEASKGISPATGAINSFVQSLSSFGLAADQAAVMQQKYNNIARDGVATNGEAVDYLARFKQQTGDLTQYTQQNITETQGLLQAMIQAGQAQDQYTKYMSDGSLSAQEAADMNSRLAEINRILGDAGLTATGGVGNLPPALQSLATYATNAAAQINAAIQSANAAVASAQSYITQAKSWVGQFKPDTPAQKIETTYDFSNSKFMYETDFDQLLSQIYSQHTAAGR